MDSAVPTSEITLASHAEPAPSSTLAETAVAEDEPASWAAAVQQYVIHVQPHETPRYRRLLQIGCGLGYLSALAARRGWQVVGLDESAAAVSAAASRFALDVRAGTLAQHGRTLPPFDAAFLGNVLERSPDPAALLRGVRRALAPGGVVCIDTPNWGARWRRWGGPRWLGLSALTRKFGDVFVLAFRRRLFADAARVGRV